MKTLYAFSFALFFASILSAQHCPDSLYLTSQAQIDSFQILYPNCTEIEGDVMISGGDITNLNGLNQLTSIGGELKITNNHVLSSCAGLENLFSVDGNVRISYNDNLSSLSGMPHLTLVRGELWISHNNVLTSLSGLNNVSFIGGWLGIAYNNVLSSLTGLDNLISIGGGFNTYDNPNLSSLEGLNNLNSIGGDLSIHYTNLVNLKGLDNVTSIGGNLYINHNDDLTSLKGLSNLNAINGSLIIGKIAWTMGGNPSLSSLAGLENVVSVGGELAIVSNHPLTSLKGLENMTSIGGKLTIYNNFSLNNLTGLINVSSIGGGISIEKNYTLTSLKGLDNIDAGSISDLHIEDNYSLFTCEVHSVCEYLANPNGTVNISDNEIGCNSPEEVQDSCLANAVTIGELDLLQSISIFPNPTQSSITIELPTQPLINTSLTISNTNGQLLITQPIIEPKTEIDISSLPVGIYIIKVWNHKEMMVRKVMKR